MKNPSTLRGRMWRSRAQAEDADSPGRRESGFTLIETLVAVVILTFGLLAVGQLLFGTIAGTTLARSKSAAATVARDKLDALAALYATTPGAAQLAVGSHGPEVVQVPNPGGSTVLNRFNVTYTVSTVPDPRPGKVLNAVLVRVTATPITAAGQTNLKTSQNKVVSVTGTFSKKY